MNSDRRRRQWVMAVQIRAPVDVSLFHLSVCLLYKNITTMKWMLWLLLWFGREWPRVHFAISIFCIWRKNVCRPFASQKNRWFWRCIINILIFSIITLLLPTSSPANGDNCTHTWSVRFIGMPAVFHRAHNSIKNFPMKLDYKSFTMNCIAITWRHIHTQTHTDTPIYIQTQ